jgi:type VI secretion system protein ImpC
MPDPPRYSVNLDVSPGRRRSPVAPLPDDPFRICLIGDFHGRGGASADGGPLATRRPMSVDRDDLDEVLARFAPRLSLDIGDDTEVELSFSELEHFHPDQIFQRAPFFRALREARSRLASAETFQGTLASILGGPVGAPSHEPNVDAGEVIADTLSGAGSVLDRVIDGETRDDSMRAFLKRIVAPHAVPGEDPRREAMLADLDRSGVRGMRSILHHPRFQALEALWRSVFFLVRRLETGPSLKLLLLDATTGELSADGAAEDLSGALDGTFSVLMVDHAFGATQEDLTLLRTLAGSMRSAAHPNHATWPSGRKRAGGRSGTRPRPERWAWCCRGSCCAGPTVPIATRATTLSSRRWARPPYTSTSSGATAVWP